MGKVGAVKGGRQRRQWRRGVGGKRSLRPWDSTTSLIWLVAICMLGLGVFVEATPGDDFLKEREGPLATLAQAVQANDVHKCELLNTCTGRNCSRNTCLPEKDDVYNYLCINVTFNKYCNASVAGCVNKYFDYNRSFVRTAGNTDFDSVLTTIGTCAQRALDPVFKTLSTPNVSVTRIYFGANDGSFRTFPGSDEDVNNPECSVVKYDNRLRPWYRAAIYVPKIVAILVDAGQSMSAPLSSGQGQGTTLSAAKLIAREFVKTLFVQDYVNIIMFDSSKATPLSSIMVQVQQYRNLSDTTFLPELDPLLQNLDKQGTENQPGVGASSDVTKGVNAALSGFATVNLDAAKIILVLTDGKFVGDGSTVSLPVTNLTSSNVKVFIYKIRSSNDGALFLGNTSFANELCSIGASFEVMSSDLSNPLLALHSFFTFTATLHVAVTNGSVDYSMIYPGYEQIVGNITTASMPVFSANKTLLGVVGMDINIYDLGNLTALVQAAIQDRSQGHVFRSAEFKLTDGGCSQIQNTLPPATPCPGVAIPQLGGFCDRTDFTSTIEDLSCCGGCIKPSGKKDHGDKKAGIISGAVAASAVVILFLCLLWYWRKTKIPPADGTEAHYKEFEGPDNEPPRQIKDQTPDGG